MKTLLLFLSIAQAGWLSDWCERHLVADDPYQYEEAPTAWIEYKVYYLDVKRRSGMADKSELRLLKLLEQELQRRQ